jgi:hypothetical protein
MSAFSQALSDTPPCIETNVLEKINAMFSRSAQNSPAVEPTKPDMNKAEEKPLYAAAISPPLDEAAWFGNKGSVKKTQPETGNPQKTEETEKATSESARNASDEDEGEYYDATPSQPEYITKSRVLARYVYPLEQRPPHLPLLDWPPPALAPVALPSLFSLVGLVWDTISSFISSSEPNVVEYSAAEIKKNKANITVRVEAQQVQFTLPRTPNYTPSPSQSSSETADAEPETVVGIVVLLHFDTGHGGKKEVIPIMAIPKRVRQLLKMEGVNDLAEELYGKEIKVALGRLRNLAAEEEKTV